jgi:hypothetical protein
MGEWVNEVVGWMICGSFPSICFVDWVGPVKKNKEKSPLCSIYTYWLNYNYTTGTRVETVRLTDMKRRSSLFLKIDRVALLLYSPPMQSYNRLRFRIFSKWKCICET